jgi:hypothetical protein
MSTSRCLIAIVLIGLFAGVSFSSALTDSLKPGKADAKSAGPLAFGPEGILFVGDTMGAAVYALDTRDRTAATAAPIDIKGMNEKVAAMVGTTRDEILINGLAVNPISKNIYVSVLRGRGPAAIPVIFRVDTKGTIIQLSLENINHSKIALTDAPEAAAGNRRLDSITDIDYVDGKVLVAGLSNEEFASALRVVPFPFEKSTKGTSIEIWHTDHGRYETQAPIRTFVPYKIKGEQYLIAAYGCTPLVKIPVASLVPGAKVRGETIAEFGGGSTPLSMIPYTKDGHEYLLMSNTNRGVMKISADNLGDYKPITTFSDIAGVPFETVYSLQGIAQTPTVPQGVVYLDKVDNKTAAALWRNGTGSMDLKTIPLP